MWHPVPTIYRRKADVDYGGILDFGSARDGIWRTVARP